MSPSYTNPTLNEEALHSGRVRLICLKALYALLAAILATFLTAFLLNPSKIWLWEYRHFAGINLTVFAYLATAVLFCFLAAGRLRPAHFNFILAGLLTVMYASSSVPGLGDHDPWFYQAVSNKLYRAEMLANLTYHLFYLAGLNIDFVPVVFGFFTSAVFLFVSDAALSGISGWSTKQVKRVCALAYLGCSLQGLFFRGYVENTQLSVPLILLFIYFAVRYFRDPARVSLQIAYATACLAIGAMIHGENAFLIPAVPAMIGIKRLLPKLHLRDWRFSITELLISAATGATLVVLTYLLVSSLGMKVVAGNESGRQPLFVKLAEPLPVYQDFTMFSMAHFAFVGNIAVMACPALPVLFVAFRRLLHARVLRNEKESLFLVIVVLGYMGFIFLWSFDLGFPGDYDLMLSMSSPLVLLIVWSLLEFFNPCVACAILGVSFLYVWPTLFLWLR